MAAKTQTSPALSPARAQLQQALEAKQRAIALVEKAVAVVDAADEAVAKARAEAAHHDEIADDSIKARLAALKGDVGAKSADEIRESRRARLIAKEELLASDETLEAAKRELQVAQGNIARSEKVMASHATSVLGESVRDVISLWDAVNQERERLRTILRAFIVAEVNLDAMTMQQQANILSAGVSQAGLPFGDAQDWKHLQAKVGGALSRNYAQPDPGPGIARARAHWASFADAILADPTAELAPLPGSDVLFG